MKAKLLQDNNLEKEKVIERPPKYHTAIAKRLGKDKAKAQVLNDTNDLKQ